MYLFIYLFNLVRVSVPFEYNSNEWFAFRKFNNFGIFQEFPYHLNAFRNYPNFWLKHWSGDIVHRKQSFSKTFYKTEGGGGRVGGGGGGGGGGWRGGGREEEEEGEEGEEEEEEDDDDYDGGGGGDDKID